MPDDITPCTVHVMGLYPNIPRDEGSVILKKSLESKTISVDCLMDLVQCMLKNNIFKHNLSFFKYLKGTAIGAKMTPMHTYFFGRPERKNLARLPFSINLVELE